MSRPSGFRPGGLGGEIGGAGQQLTPKKVILDEQTVIPPAPPSTTTSSSDAGISEVSRTSILNEALPLIGITQPVANIDLDDTTTAIAGRRIFQSTVNYVLREFPWPFAMRYVKPGLVAGTSSEPANRDWIYSYRFPSDCVFVRRILSPLGRTSTVEPEFSIGSDSTGRLIYTDLTEAEIQYTARVTDPQQFDAMFVAMLTWKLAAMLAPGLSRVENMARSCMQMYEAEKERAKRVALNESRPDKDPESEFISARS